MAASTFVRVASDTFSGSLRTRLTVAVETPARRDTSLTLARFIIPPSSRAPLTTTPRQRVLHPRPQSVVQVP